MFNAVLADQLLFERPDVNLLRLYNALQLFNFILHRLAHLDTFAPHFTLLAKCYRFRVHRLRITSLFDQIAEPVSHPPELLAAEIVQKVQRAQTFLNDLTTNGISIQLFCDDLSLKRLKMLALRFHLVPQLFDLCVFDGQDSSDGVIDVIFAGRLGGEPLVSFLLNFTVELRHQSLIVLLQQAIVVCQPLDLCLEDEQLLLAVLHLVAVADSSLSICLLKSLSWAQV